jgi:hypothetical protein
VAKGGNQAFTATVSGTGNPAETVTWSVSGGGAGPDISADGILSVATDETAATLTVRATSTVDTAKSGTASVSVTTAQALGDITVGFDYDDITITGSNGINVISKSGAYGPRTLTLSATDYTSVVWYVDGSATGTAGSGGAITINAAGYRVGSHSVTFTGKRDGVPYSQVLPFAVAE